MSILYHHLLPFISRVVKVIELLDHDSLSSLAIIRGDVVAIHATADPASAQILVGSIAGERTGDGLGLLASFDQTHLADKGTSHHFLDGVSSLLLR